MAYSEKHIVPAVVDASGDFVGYTPVVNGRILNVIYNKTDYADTADFTITTADTAQNVWVESNVTASKTVAPRQATHDTIGVASLYAATFPVEDYVYAAGERVKIVVGSGGVSKTGSFTVIVGG